MKDKIDLALEYYSFRSKKVLDFVNSNQNLTPDQIIESGEKLSILEYKITSLEVAKEN
ncbi:hypothetical protein OD91_1856 [Lutibacter sp. Hel_I_33_5]|uniref:hypothetical protein n=1 Tax=Lutibacter sp. Hel_I_33_5 TaxID=1566289 RepID=UPI0011ACB938|nr:hypothetical protein [Lutibacter sp. Hel_I_33_5]TVZ56567.1 hypothetical protein OD91_1856 [Lutibacter sp. Hel_I_33_5]